MAKETGISAFGAYIPRLRLKRQAAAMANAWLAPALIAKAKGFRSMANWDEDSLTMAVEACRDLLGPDDNRDHVDSLAFASTTMPFADRQNSAIVAAALTLKEDMRSWDASASMRAGTSALIQAFVSARAGEGSALVVASDKRRARAASAQELDYGDGAAAFLVGQGEGIAKFLGSHTLTVDFADHFRGASEEFDYHWEERWIRDEGFAKLVPRTVGALFKKTGAKPSDVKHFILPCPFPRIVGGLAKSCGVSPDAVRDSLAEEVGATGAAHPFLMLAHALEEAKPGEKILLAQFASGCDALLFEATKDIKAKVSHRRGVSGHLSERQEEENYMKFLVFNGLIEWEKGMRAEQDHKTALTTLYRNREAILGLVGGKCSKTGTIQFPRTRISVNPNDPAVDTQEPYKFAERRAKILSWSGDYLSFGVNPPNHYGMMVFDEGGRIMMDMTDVSPGEVETGMLVRMVFRVKDVDEKRGFTRYFWKAVPVR